MRSCVFSLLLACSGDPTPAAAPPAAPEPVVDPAAYQADRSGTSVLFVVMDTVRADRLGAYGHDRPTSPNLDALATHADRYTRALSSAPWTLPSHASLFTGLAPSAHGAVTADPSGPQDDAWPLDPAHTTLAEVLGDAGYDRAGFAANTAYLDPRFGLDQGFEPWVVPGKKAERKGPALAEAAVGWLDEGWQRDRPFLLFVNLMDAHRPVNTDAVGPWAQTEPDGGALLDQLRQEVMLDGQAVDPALHARVLDQYDHGIANADVALGVLLDGLAARGLRDETLVVVTSDHGEAFGEHGLVEHSKDVWQPLVHVPLVIQAPGQNEGRVVDTPVSSAHVPSLLAAHVPPLAALPVPDDVIVENRYSRKRDLGPALGDRFVRVRQAVVDWPWKYVHDSRGEHVLYELEADPGETDDRSAEGPVEALRAKVPAVGEPAVAVDPKGGGDTETNAALRELGYVE